MTDPANTPAPEALALILGMLGRGPATRTALVGWLYGRGGRDYPFDRCEVEVGRCLLALTRSGRVESFAGGDAWRLTSSAAPMTDPDPSENAAPTKRGKG